MSRPCGFSSTSGRRVGRQRDAARADNTQRANVNLVRVPSFVPLALGIAEGAQGHPGPGGTLTPALPQARTWLAQDPGSSPARSHAPLTLN